MQPLNFTPRAELGDFPPLPTTPEPAHARPLRICICTFDIVGPIRNGGIGTAYSSLAASLAKAGHAVTVLYVLGDYTEFGTMDSHVERYASERVRFVPLPTPELAIATEGPGLYSYRAYLWLKKQEFDVIHFHEWMAPGYHSVLAKHQGLAFKDTLLVIGTHSPSLWHKVNNLQKLDTVDDLKLDYMERQSVRYADAVVSPSQYLLRWMVEQGWQLPERAYVHPNVLPQKARVADRESGKRTINEVVFFGRLEGRKGLVLFCDAIDELLKKKRRSDLQLTFLGKPGKVDGEDGDRYIHERARRWGVTLRLLRDQDNVGAMQYLRGAGRLAVIPSLVENSPYTVLECLGASIPFLASDVGGIPELVARDDHASALFPLRAGALAERLDAALTNGAAPARPALDFDEVESRWHRWHATLAAAPAVVVAPPTAIAPPLVSVCLVTHDRPQFLWQAVHSLEQQDYPHFEVVLVDDGSVEPASLAALDELEKRFATHGWRVVRQKNLYLGAARNTAARAARGAWLLFMDDDNVAKPDELSTFMAVAQKTGADVVTCQLDVFEGEWPPRAGELPVHRWLFTGGPISAGTIHNCFGDANALIKRSTFEALGGFTEDFGVGHEDWEFFAKAALSGAHLEVLVEAPVWYRQSRTGMLRTTPKQANYVRSLRPYRDVIPEALWPILNLTQGMHSAATAKDLDIAGNQEIQRVLALLTELRGRYPRFAKFGRAALKQALRLAGKIKRG